MAAVDYPSDNKEIQILATRLRIADDRFLKVKDANAALEKEIRKLRAEAA